MSTKTYEPDGDLVLAEEKFRWNIRYLIKVANTTTNALARMAATSTSAINRYARRDTPDIQKFIVLDNALFQIAINNGKYSAYMAAYAELVPTCAPPTFANMYEQARRIDRIYGL